MHPEDKLNKLKNILELLQRDTISPAQLKEFLDNLVKVIAKIKTDTEAISGTTIKEFTDMGEKILKELIAKQETITEQTTKHLDEVNSGVLNTTQQVKENKANISEVKKLLAEIKKIKTTPGKDGKDGIDGQDGKNADEKQIIKEVLNKIEIPEIEGADIVLKINSLDIKEDDLKIDASHIKNLPKTIGGNGSRYYYQLLDVDMTGITDGQVPTWDNANQRWIPGTGGGGGSQTLEDVLITGNSTNGQTINWDGNIQKATTDGSLAWGAGAGGSLTTGLDNILFGAGAGNLLTDGDYNIALGVNSLSNLVSYGYNVAIGRNTLTALTVGESNFALGFEALASLTSGYRNLAIGGSTGTNQITGDENILIGNAIDTQDVNGSNQLSIGNAIFGVGIDGTSTTVSNGQIGIFVPAPTAKLHLPASDGSAGSAPLKIEAGTVLGTPENYAFESDGTYLYYTKSDTVREQVAYISNIPTPGIMRSVFNFTILDDGSVLGNGVNTDYAYFIQDLVGVTMPSASGNTNRYTIKNVGSDDVTINAGGGNTIDGAVSPIILTASLQGSVDLISDGISNWNVV